MPSKRNVKLYEEINEILQKKPNVLITTYNGLTVAQLTELRKKNQRKKWNVKSCKKYSF